MRVLTQRVSTRCHCSPACYEIWPSFRSGDPGWPRKVREEAFGLRPSMCVMEASSYCSLFLGLPPLLPPILSCCCCSCYCHQLLLLLPSAAAATAITPALCCCCCYCHLPCLCCSCYYHKPCTPACAAVDATATAITPACAAVDAAATAIIPAPLPVLLLLPLAECATLKAHVCCCCAG